MSAKSAAPDAWDDEDWESQADKLDTPPTQPAEKKVSSKVTKAQRRAQQAEFNRQLWAEAESPQQTFHYLETRSDVPLKQDFKPTVTLLSRKPQIATRQTPSSSSAAAAGVAQMGLNGEDDDSDDEGSKRPEPTAEERQAMALKNREEKQRKYEEARERLFGSPSATTSGASSPGSTTPPLRQHEGRGGKGKGRGGGGGGGGGREREKRDSSTASSKSRHHLYDPASAVKPSAGFVQRQLHRQQSNNSDSDKNSPALQQPIRNPRGPDASGRGGFSRFANRGGRGS